MQFSDINHLTTIQNSKSYEGLLSVEGHRERLRYLMLKGSPGNKTFGAARYVNQRFYKSHAWLSTRRQVIIRDKGFDLGVEGFSIIGNIYVHHIIPINLDDIMEMKSKVLSPSNLICTSFDTHQKIHFSKELGVELVERFPGDTKLW